MKPFELVFAIALALACAAAAQADSSVPISLWGDFTTASTKEELKAFKATKPKHKVEVIPGCLAEMGYRHQKGQLVTILFLGQDKDADCFARMFADMKSRLGQPETDTTTFGSGFAFGTGSSVTSVNTTSVGIVYIWRDGEKKTKLVKSPGNGYNLIFTMRPDKYIY